MIDERGSTHPCLTSLMDLIIASLPVVAGSPAMTVDILTQASGSYVLTDDDVLAVDKIIHMLQLRAQNANLTPGARST
jgi:hypothetical protein